MCDVPKVRRAFESVDCCVDVGDTKESEEILCTRRRIYDVFAAVDKTDGAPNACKRGQGLGGCALGLVQVIFHRDGVHQGRVLAGPVALGSCDTNGA
jgi:hypothetical protein